MCLTIRLLAGECVTRRLFNWGRALLAEATNRVAGEEVRREGEFMDPGQDDVFSGLGDEHSEHGQDTRHPELNGGYRSLGEKDSHQMQFKKVIYFTLITGKSYILRLF